MPRTLRDRGLLASNLVEPTASVDYRPSYVNVLIDRIHRLPFPAPVTYAGLIAALLAVEMIAKVADGTFPGGVRLFIWRFPCSR